MTVSALISVPRRTGLGAPVAGQREEDDARRAAGRPHDRERLGFVLKVNGENSLYRQRAEDLPCTKWYLDPDVKERTIDGYQADDKKADQFKLLSRAASKEQENDATARTWARSVGRFSGEKGGRIDPAENPEAGRRGAAPDAQAGGDAESAVAAGLPRGGAGQPRGPEFKLRGGTAAGWSSRGTAPSAVVRCRVADPTPILAATVRYYRP